MKNKIAFIGSGSMATAIAKVAHDSGYENIVIYGIVEEELKDLEKGKNTKFFEKTVNLPSFKTTSDIKEAVEDADYVVIGVPSKFVDGVLEKIIDNLNSKITIINLSKGFYPNTELSIHDGISHETKDNPNIVDVVSIIGPSHAEEIVLEVPTIVSVVGHDVETLKSVQKIFHNNYFSTFYQTDIVGAEVGAAYKNVLAIATGLASGLGHGINTTAGLLARGVTEMSRFNKIMGGKSETLMGLTGIGDIIVTATSPLSRNYTFGSNLAKKGLEALNTNTTVEGLTALKIIHKIGKKNNVDLPIINALYDVINGEDPSIMIKRIWSGESKSEY